jgi:hypothetical protein
LESELVTQLRSEVTYLRQTLDAEIEARRRAANEGPSEAMPEATTEAAARQDGSLWGRFWQALTGR